MKLIKKLHSKSNMISAHMYKYEFFVNDFENCFYSEIKQTV